MTPCSRWLSEISLTHPSLTLCHLASWHSLEADDPNPGNSNKLVPPSLLQGALPAYRPYNVHPMSICKAFGFPDPATAQVSFSGQEQRQPHQCTAALIQINTTQMPLRSHLTSSPSSSMDRQIVHFSSVSDSSPSSCSALPSCGLLCSKVKDIIWLDLAFLTPSKAWVVAGR